MTATVNAATDSWSFFDKIYCISIAERRDRRREAREQFARAGLLEKVEFILVKKHENDRELGIYQSHLSCLQKGLAAGAEHILIFEDDIIFKKFSPARLEEACEFLGGRPEWNMLFLGGIVRGSRKTSRKSVAMINYRCLAHAYGVNRKFAEELVRKPWRGIPFDNLLGRINREFYAVCPMFAFQSNSRSDNQTTLIDKRRRMLGGLIFIQRANELFHRQKTLIIISHLAAIVILGYLILK